VGAPAGTARLFSRLGANLNFRLLRLPGGVRCETAEHASHERAKTRLVPILSAQRRAVETDEKPNSAGVGYPFLKGKTPLLSDIFSQATV